MHPLVGDLSALSDNEVNEKYASLIRRLNQATRMGYGDAVQQLQMFLGDYQAEIQRRQEKLLNDLADKDAEFKNIIDIQ